MTTGLALTVPVFLFSAPRSGSTLVQRLLVGHDQIASAPETWLLLPQFYALRRNGSESDYSAETCADALEDFCEQLPEGLNTYRRYLREFACGLYSEYCTAGETYFVDKTPRYYLILQEIIETFPEGKFIFLLRNPTDIAASIISTWGQGRFHRLYWNTIDLEQAPQRLVAGIDRLGPNCHVLHYEALVASPESELRRLCEYLGLPFQHRMLEQLDDNPLPGRLGDPHRDDPGRGIRVAASADAAQVFGTALRRLWLLRYLNRLNASDVQRLGYDICQLRREAAGYSSDPKFTPVRDVLDMANSWIRLRLPRRHRPPAGPLRAFRS